MTNLFRYFWLQNRSALLWSGLGTWLTAWLLAAPLAPLKDGVLRLVAESPLLQKFGAAVMGVDLQGELTVKLLAGTTWSHPFLFALLWGFAVSRSTHFPVEAAEEKTIDFLFAIGGSRWQILAVQHSLLAACLLGLTGIALFGFQVGCLPLRQDAPALAEMVPVALNLLCTSLAVLSLASLASVLCRTRSQALGICATVCLWSLLLGYLQPVLPWAKKLSVFGLMHYYRPGEIMQSQSFPTQPCASLLLIALVLTLGAMVRVTKRDL